MTGLLLSTLLSVIVPDTSQERSIRFATKKIGLRFSSEVPVLGSVGPSLELTKGYWKIQLSAGYSWRPYFSILPIPIGESGWEYIHGGFAEVAFRTNLFPDTFPSCACLGVNPLATLKYYRFFYSPQGREPFNSLSAQIGITLSARDFIASETDIDIYYMHFLNEYMRDICKGSFGFGLNIWLFKLGAKP